MNPKDEKQMVKGLMLLDYVKLIRARKDIKWEELLSPDDLKIINARILPMGWYPFETYRNVGKAVLNEVAKGDMKIVKLFGRSYMQNVVENIYAFLSNRKDVFEAFKGLQDIGSRFFNFAHPKFDKIGDRSLRVSIVGAPNDELVEALSNQLMGAYEFLVEKYGGKNVKTSIEKRQWKGDDITSFLIDWE